MDDLSRLKVSRAESVALRHLADLLHLFHHRNKNQHRRSVWWRKFQLFRKQLSGLVVEITALNDVPPTHLARAKKKIQDKETLQAVEQRLSFWRDVMVPKWQHAFSQVAADGRFAMLGLVLIAALAEACRIVGITAAFEDLGQAEVEKVLEEFARENWGQRGREGETGLGEDVGEAMIRETATGNDANAGEHVVVTSPVKARSSPSLADRAELQPAVKRKRSKTEKAVKGKRPKGDAIDDLFAGLG